MPDGSGSGSGTKHRFSSIQNALNDRQQFDFSGFVEYILPSIASSSSSFIQVIPTVEPRRTVRLIDRPLQQRSQVG